MTIQISNKVCGWTLFTISALPIIALLAAVAREIFKALIALNDWGCTLHGWPAAFVGIGSAVGMIGGLMWSQWDDAIKEASS